jgi:hypothetical protein
VKSKLLTTESSATRYTLAEAENMLPLIKAIAGEIVERHRLRRELHRSRSSFESAKSPEGLTAAIADASARIFDQTEGIRGALDEFIELGLTVLRLHPLTIHIPGRSVSGPLVFCWQVGDDGIAHGHRVGEEDDPRRPLRVRAPNGFRA